MGNSNKKSMDFRVASKYKPPPSHKYTAMFAIMLFITLFCLVSHLIGTDKLRASFNQAWIFNTNSTKTPLKIYVRSAGRLGNIMFQLAALYGISRKTGRTGIYYLYKSAYNDQLLKNFPIEKVPVEIWRKDIPPTVSKHLIHINGDNYSTSIFPLPQADALICCYFNTLKYWVEFSKEIKNLFAFTDHVVQKAKGVIQGIKSNFTKEGNILLIGVHVRRADFIQKYGEDYLPKPSYYNNSMQYFSQKYADRTCVFIVISEDMGWCHSHLNFSGRHIHFLKKQTAFEDMETLRQCDHIITSKGTYSWWSAFLSGGGATFHVKKPYHATNSTIISKTNSVIPPNWVPIPD